MTAQWLTQAEAARHCRIGARTFRRRVKAGLLPKGHPVSDRRLVWTAEELDAAILGNDDGQHTDPIMAAIHAADAKAAEIRGEKPR